MFNESHTLSPKRSCAVSGKFSSSSSRASNKHKFSRILLFLWLDSRTVNTVRNSMRCNPTNELEHTKDATHKALSTTRASIRTDQDTKFHCGTNQPRLLRFTEKIFEFLLTEPRAFRSFLIDLTNLLHFMAGQWIEKRTSHEQYNNNTGKKNEKHATT